MLCTEWVKGFEKLSWLDFLALMWLNCVVHDSLCVVIWLRCQLTNDCAGPWLGPRWSEALTSPEPAWSPAALHYPGPNPGRVILISLCTGLWAVALHNSRGHHSCRIQSEWYLQLNYGEGSDGLYVTPSPVPRTCWWVLLCHTQEQLLQAWTRGTLEAGMGRADLHLLLTQDPQDWSCSLHPCSPSGSHGHQVPNVPCLCPTVQELTPLCVCSSVWWVNELFD